MSRVTVYHLTPLACLPLIEEEGLRTRADLSDLLGPLSAEDETAPGVFAHGRRVSAYLSEEYARSRKDEHGGGLVSFTVDPGKAVAAPSSAREGRDPSSYWERTRPLEDWLEEGDPPEDLEVHQNVPVRAKHVRIHTALIDEDELGSYAPLVAAVADEDRLSAKAVMHLAIIASEGDFDSREFAAAVALAYRDAPDPGDLVRELVEIGVDRVASAVLAEHRAVAPEASRSLRETLDDVRAWADANGVEHGQAILVRSAAVLDDLESAR